jgi:hypothetical protein
LTITALAVAAVAIAVAVGSWFRPEYGSDASTVSDAPAYGEQEIADAKTALCEAHALVGRATRTAAARRSDDPTITYIVATNVRLSATASSDYIRQKLLDYPAAPSNLANALRTLAVTYQQTTLLNLADAQEAELDTAYNLLDKTDAEVVKACQ